MWTNKLCGVDTSCSYNSLLVGLLVSATVICILNVQFYTSMSTIKLNMKGISIILRNMNFSNWKGEGSYTKYCKNTSFLKSSSVDDSEHCNNQTSDGIKMRVDKFCPWPPRYLYGRQSLNRTILDIEVLNRVHAFMTEGHYKPHNCTPVKKVAIIVPYRDRYQQLKIFLNNVLPRIYRQQLEFGIYIVEQAPGLPFNRGMLANIGFRESMLDMDYDCLVVHDLDILPEDDRNFYICMNNPVHMAVNVEQFGYKLIYPNFAGGITTFSREQFEKINGFPNRFFGWGGEDDDLYNRIVRNRYKLTRPFIKHGYCGSVNHKAANKRNNRIELLKLSTKISHKDGLNNLEYDLLFKKRLKLYNWIYSKIEMTNIYKQIED